MAGNNTRHIIIGISVALVIGLFLCCGVGGFLIYSVTKTGDIFTTTVDYPSYVQVDEQFAMTVTITNPHNQSLSFDSIDIESSFFDGFQVVSVTPQPKKTSQMFGLHTWEFLDSVDANSTRTITFQLKAVKDGRFTGTLDVWKSIFSLDFTSEYVDIIVNEERQIQEGQKTDPFMSEE